MSTFSMSFSKATKLSLTLALLASVVEVSSAASVPRGLVDAFTPDNGESFAAGFFRGDAVSATANESTAYLRIASLAIALYDYLCTIPGEIKLYRSQPSLFRMSRACVLFILVRYISIAALVTSNIGFFGSGFSAGLCKHYHLVAPLMKLFAVIVSQIIISIRTYAISRKEPWVLYVLGTIFVLSLVPEFLGNVWQRKPVQNIHGSCTSGNEPTHMVAWVHYLAAVVFDTVAMIIATGFLITYAPSRSMMSALSRLMLKEGMTFFLILTGVNILNLVMFRVSTIAAQSSAACLGQAVTMIMSQRIILSLQDWRSSGTSQNGPSSGPDSHHLHDLSVSRSRFPNNTHASPVTPNSGMGFIGSRDTKSRNHHTMSRNSVIPDFTRTSSSLDDDTTGGIHVHVEHEVVKMDYESGDEPKHSDRKAPAPWNAV